MVRDKVVRMSNGETTISTIPRLRRVFYDTKANLDALTGLAVGDLGYATDNLLFYRWSGIAWEVVAGYPQYVNISPAHGQIMVGIGTATNPENGNDNNTANNVVFQVIDKTLVILFPSVMLFNRFRYYGVAGQNEDGLFDTEYKAPDGNWYPYVPDKPTNLAVWSGWDTSGPTVLAIGFRFVATTLDTGNGNSYIAEVELSWS